MQIGPQVRRGGSNSRFCEVDRDETAGGVPITNLELQKIGLREGGQAMMSVANE
jgi:hypothetical protein